MSTPYAKDNITSFARDQRSMYNILQKFDSEKNTYEEDKLIHEQPEWALFAQANIHLDDASNDTAFSMTHDNNVTYDWAKYGRLFGKRRIEL